MVDFPEDGVRTKVTPRGRGLPRMDAGYYNTHAYISFRINAEMRNCWGKGFVHLWFVFLENYVRIGIIWKH